MLELINVSVVYDPKTIFQKEAINGINLKIGLDESLSIVGRIGSGKSTLIQLLNGLIKPNEGVVLLDGIDINSKKISKKEIIKKVGLVFQYPEEQFFAETVYDEVAFGPRNIGYKESEIPALVDEALLEMGLIPETIKNRSPFNLSGGEKRRVAIASILAMKPKLLVLDEPTSGMDFVGKSLIISKLKQRTKSKQGVIIITHSMEEAILFSERLIVLDKGRIKYDGHPKDFFVSIEKVKRAGLEVPFSVNFGENIKNCFKNVPIFRDNDEIVQFFETRGKIEKK